MRKWAWISGAVIAAVVIAGCEKPKVPIAQKLRPQGETNKVAYVRFMLEPSGDLSDTHRRYNCSYQKGGKVARFALDLQIKGSTRAGPVDNPSQMSDKPHVEFKGSTSAVRFKSGQGSIIAQPGSDASIFLADLRQALEATRMPSHGIRIRQLPFDFAVLGEHMAPAANAKADFVDSEDGKWTSLKLFIGPRTDEVQVFLNFEADGGQGEFSLKDPVYGDKLLNELAKVL